MKATIKRLLFIKIMLQLLESAIKWTLRMLETLPGASACSDAIRRER